MEALPLQHVDAEGVDYDNAHRDSNDSQATGRDERSTQAKKKRGSLRGTRKSITKDTFLAVGSQAGPDVFCGKDSLETGSHLEFTGYGRISGRSERSTAESPQKAEHSRVLGTSPQKTEPSLVQICDLVHNLDVRQQVYYEDLLKNVNDVQKRISNALDLWAPSGAGTKQEQIFTTHLQANGCSPPQHLVTDGGHWGNGHSPLQQPLEQRNACAGQPNGGPLGKSTRFGYTIWEGINGRQSDFDRRNMSQVSRAPKATTWTHAPDDYGELYVRISVQMSGETGWRCPKELGSSATSSVELNRTVTSEKKKPGKLAIRLVSARGLMNLDVIGTSDPYCVCGVINKVEGSEHVVRDQFRTKVIHNTLEPGWNHEHKFENFGPGDVLLFAVKDKDIHANGFGADQVLGTCSLSFEDIMPRGWNARLPLNSIDGGAKDDILLLCDAEDNDKTPQRSKGVTQINNVLHRTDTMKEKKNDAKSNCITAMQSQRDTIVNVIMGCIILMNAFFLGIALDTEDDIITVFDAVFTFLFVVEMIYKMKRESFKGYYRSSWNCFDFVIVILDLVQLVLAPFIKAGMENTPRAAMFRMLRLARALRLGRIFLTLTHVEILGDLVAMISGIMAGLQTLLWAIVLFLVVVYFTSLMFRELFGRTSYYMTCPECGDVDMTEYFNSVPRTMLTVFRFFLGDFTTIQGVNLYEAINLSYGAVAGSFSCIVFFVVFVGVFNVITAIFVERTLKAASKLEQTRMSQRMRDPELWRTRIRILIERLFDKQGGLDIDLEDSQLAERIEELSLEPVFEGEFQEFIKDTDVVRALHDLEIDEADHNNLFGILDADNTGSLTLTEFFEGLSRLRGSPRRSDIITIDLMVRVLQEQMHNIQEGVDHLMQYLPEYVVSMAKSEEVEAAFDKRESEYRNSDRESSFPGNGREKRSPLDLEATDKRKYWAGYKVPPQAEKSKTLDLGRLGRDESDRLEKAQNPLSSPSVDFDAQGRLLTKILSDSPGRRSRNLRRMTYFSDPGGNSETE